MRILLTGADGQLGVELSRQLDRRGWTLIAAPRSALDITNPHQIESMFAAQHFDLVVNAAAYTDVDRAEREAEAAFAANADGPGYLARACAEQGAALMHVSTDYVFDGSKPGPYCEVDAPCPANTYGRSKDKGESIIRETLGRHLIIRTAWLFGAHGRNFVRTMLRLAGRHDELNVVADQIGNPTAAADLAWCIGELAKALEEGRGGRFPWGTYHCVNRDAVSWHAFAEAIFTQAAPTIGRRPLVRAIGTADYPTPAFRPLNSRLDCAKLQQTFGIVMPPWRRILPQVIHDILSSRNSPGDAR